MIWINKTIQVFTETTKWFHSDHKFVDLWNDTSSQQKGINLKFNSIRSKYTVNYLINSISSNITAYMLQSKFFPHYIVVKTLVEKILSIWEISIMLFGLDVKHIF